MDLKQEKTQVDKPNSVLCTEALSLYHLSRLGVTSPALSAYPPALGEQPSSAGLHGISTHKVYP